jgi:hypothetical protein
MKSWMVPALAEHHRRTERLLDRLEVACRHALAEAEDQEASPERREAAEALAVTQLLDHLADLLRQEDAQLAPLTARLEEHGSSVTAKMLGRSTVR